MADTAQAPETADHRPAWSVSRLAHEWGCSTSTIYKMIDDGQKAAARDPFASGPNQFNMVADR